MAPKRRNRAQVVTCVRRKGLVTSLRRTASSKLTQQMAKLELDRSTAP